MNLLELVRRVESALDDAGVSFGHGTQNAFDEAAWLVLWALHLPLDTLLTGEQSHNDQPLRADAMATVDALLAKRIQTRQPLAYLTREAWLKGVAFYVDERVIVPRSLIAEPLVDGQLDIFLPQTPQHVLDICTGNGSLAVLAAMTYPQASVTATDLSADALAVARINLKKHGMQERVTLLQGDALSIPALAEHGLFDLVLCNPPYVSAKSMATLPPEFLAEPDLALNGNQLGGGDGMDFVRVLLGQTANYLQEQGVLVLEIGHERAHFEEAFPKLDALWLETSAGGDQVLLLTRSDLLAAGLAAAPDSRFCR